VECGDVYNVWTYGKYELYLLEGACGVDYMRQQRVTSHVGQANIVMLKPNIKLSTVFLDPEYPRTSQQDEKPPYQDLSTNSYMCMLNANAKRDRVYHRHTLNPSLLFFLYPGQKCPIARYCLLYAFVLR